MARPPEFDRADAIERALRLFWKQGYLATSLQQLLDAMEISRSSFYAAFGDKRSLFVEVLTLFAERTRNMLREARVGRPPLDATTRFFEITLLEVPRRRAARGCLMVNTILELANVDPGLSALAAKALAGVEGDFEDMFTVDFAVDETGDGGGDRLRSSLDAGELAKQIMLINQGLRVESRKRVSRRDLAGRIETSMSLLAATFSS